MKRANRRFISVLALAMGASVSALPYAVAAGQSVQSDTNVQAEVINKALNKPSLKDVKVTAHDGVVTLTGTVPLFDLKQEADRRTHKIKGVQSVSNEIEVAGQPSRFRGRGKARESYLLRPRRIRHDTVQRDFRPGAGWNSNTVGSCLRACRCILRSGAGGQHAGSEKCRQRGPSRSDFADG